MRKCSLVVLTCLLHALFGKPVLADYHNLIQRDLMHFANQGSIYLIDFPRTASVKLPTVEVYRNSLKEFNWLKLKQWDIQILLTR